MDINEELTSISKKQKRYFREFNKKIEENVNTIFNILQTHSTYPISRVQVLGTIGIKSPRKNMNQPDFNLVVFANFETYQFKGLLENLESCLLCNGDKFNTEFTMDWRTLSSVYFRMKDVTTSEALPSRTVSYITFELLPTLNLLSPAEAKLGARNREETQAERTLQFISQLSSAKMKKLTAYNCGLSERYVAFVEQQSHFVQEVIRLAKLWNRMVSWDGPYRMRERTKIIEVVAISVAVAEEKAARSQFRNKSISHAFDAFLEKFVEFDKLMKEVPKYETNDDLTLDLPYQKYVDQTLVSDNGPMILDPVNPFNNLAEQVPTYMKLVFKAYAEITRQKLKNFAFQSGNRRENTREIDICFGICSSADE